MPEDLASKIAAGEVVERPASVVKELVENSLDAGSSRIAVEVRGGGKSLIRVEDNGQGMERDDALLAFERHATSKISSEKDLWTVASLGFRGEALPSIARVSRIEMVTRSPAGETGTRVRIAGGSVQTVEEAAAPPGTVISIEDLFFNTPARKKFLRSDSAEYGHIWDAVSRFLLVYPGVHFVLRKDGREVLAAPPASGSKERAALILGEETGRGLYECECSTPAGRLYALASGPSVHRSSSQGIFLFVNGRYVRDRSLSHAVSSAYSKALTKGRWPVCLLFLDIPPRDLDVNVHPSKMEVRFRMAREVHDLVLRGLGTFLMRAPWLGVPVARAAVPTPVARETETAYSGGTAAGMAEAPRASQTVLPIPSGPAYSSLRVIGQSKDTYIIAQSPDGLVLIDQHAAAERVCFVRLKEGYAARRPLRQPFLMPEAIELPPAQADVLTHNRINLADLGIEIEPFGRSTVLLKAVPAPLVDSDYVSLLADIADTLPDDGSRPAFDRRLEDLFARMACHSSVRAGASLNRAEMEHLLRDLDEVEYSAFCPHGRPVAHVIPFVEIEGMFGRR